MSKVKVFDLFGQHNYRRKESRFVREITAFIYVTLP